MGQLVVVLEETTEVSSCAENVHVLVVVSVVTLCVQETSTKRDIINTIRDDIRTMIVLEGKKNALL